MSDNKPKVKAPAESGKQAGAESQKKLYNAQGGRSIFDTFSTLQSVDGNGQQPPQNGDQTAGDMPTPQPPATNETPEERYEKLLKAGEKVTRTSRNWAFIVYPDSAEPDWIDRLEAEHVPAFVSPLHDKDKDKHGAKKKPHYHVLVHFSSHISYGNALDLVVEVLGIYGATPPEKVKVFDAYARYLCHLDNKNKTQYAREDVIEMGGLDYGLHSINQRDNEVQTMMDLKEIADIIEANKITNFFQLFRHAQNIAGDDDYRLMQTIMHRTYFVNNLVNGNYQQVNNDINQKEKEINEEYNNLKSRNQYRQAEREQLFARIEALEAENETLRGARM